MKAKYLPEKGENWTVRLPTSLKGELLALAIQCKEAGLAFNEMAIDHIKKFAEELHDLLPKRKQTVNGSDWPDRPAA